MGRNSLRGLIATLLASVDFASATVRGTTDQQQILLGPSSPPEGIPYVFRDAVASDIDDVATVVLDAFAPAPHVRYVYQFRDRYPEYHRECMRQAVTREFAQFNPNETVVKVIAVDDPGRAGAGTRASRVVALGIWNIGTPNGTYVGSVSPFGNPLGLGLPLDEGMSSTITRSGSGGGNGSFNCSAHLDMNMTRALDVDEKFKQAKKSYIEDTYGHYVYLNLLATHPEWDGNGFGATHCRWGMKLAKERSENVTLIATPAGFPLYRSLGFQNVKNVTIEMFDGLGTLWYEVMSYDPKV